MSSVREGLRSRGIPFETASRPAPPAAPITPDDQSGQTAELDFRAVRQKLAALGVIPFEDRSRIPTAPLAVAAPLPTPDPDATGQIDGSQVAEALRSRGIPFAEPTAQPSPATGQGEAFVTTAPTSRSDTGTEEIDIRKLGLALPATPKTELIEQIDFSTFQASVAATQKASAPQPAPSTAIPLAPGALPIQLERFAEIQAALTKSRDRDGVLHHFGFTALTWAPISREIAAALTADPNLRARYELLYREAMHHGR